MPTPQAHGVSQPRRVVLLDGLELTGRQKAQKKYRESPKGRAAQRRSKRKRRADPVKRAVDHLRVREWKKTHVMQQRVYQRIYQRRWKREREIEKNRASARERGV